MACNEVRLPNGNTAFVCSRRIRPGDKEPGHVSCPLCSEKLPPGATPSHLQERHGLVRG